MILPKTIQIAGQTIRVIKDPTFVKEHGMYGWSDYEQQVIIIDPSAGGPDFVALNFFHEVVHWHMKTMGRRELCNDEPFVDMLANLMYQVFKPMMVQSVTEPIITDQFILANMKP